VQKRLAKTLLGWRATSSARRGSRAEIRPLYGPPHRKNTRKRPHKPLVERSAAVKIKDVTCL
jgi:hypothetical protein